MNSSKLSNPTQRPRRGWPCAFLTLLCASCAVNPPAPGPGIVHKTERQRVPASLVLQTPAPRFEGSLNADLAKWGQALQEALGQCNADKASIATWSSTTPPQ